MKKSVAMMVAIAAVFGSTVAKAGGEVYFSGGHNFGTMVTGPGNSSFMFGDQNGAPAVFQGSVYTPKGFSQIWGQIGAWGNAYVPDGTKGMAQAGGNMTFNLGAGHEGSTPYTSYGTQVNTWANSSGTGSASSQFKLEGNTSSSTGKNPGKG